MDPDETVETEEDETYAIPVPEGGEDDDVLVINICTPEQAEAIFAQDEDEEL